MAAYWAWAPGNKAFWFLSEEKETEENKELTDTCKERESDLGKKKVEHEISEGNVATAAAAALASAATKAKVCHSQPLPGSLRPWMVALFLVTGNISTKSLAPNRRWLLDRHF